MASSPDVLQKVIHPWLFWLGQKRWSAAKMWQLTKVNRCEEVPGTLGSHPHKGLRAERSGAWAAASRKPDLLTIDFKKQDHLHRKGNKSFVCWSWAVCAFHFWFLFISGIVNLVHSTWNIYSCTVCLMTSFPILLHNLLWPPIAILRTWTWKDQCICFFGFLYPINVFIYGRD